MAEIMMGCQARPKTPTITEKVCPNCGNVIELFSIDTEVACDKCGFVAYNDELSCVQWCKYAKDCVGEEMYEHPMKVAEQQKKPRRDGSGQVGRVLRHPPGVFPVDIQRAPLDRERVSLDRRDALDDAAPERSAPAERHVAAHIGRRTLFEQHEAAAAVGRGHGVAVDQEELDKKGGAERRRQHHRQRRREKASCGTSHALPPSCMG